MREILDVIINKALEFENEGIHFYQQAQQKTLSSVAKSMFELLKEQEQRHIKILESIRSEFYAREQYPAVESFDWQSLNFKTLFQQYVPRMEQEITPQSDEFDALRLALDIESNGITLYEGFIEQLEDDNGKLIFSRLADEERKHYEFIESFLKFFEDKGLKMQDG